MIEYLKQTYNITEDRTYFTIPYLNLKCGKKTVLPLKYLTRSAMVAVAIEVSLLISRIQCQGTRGAVYLVGLPKLANMLKKFALALNISSQTLIALSLIIGLVASFAIESKLVKSKLFE